MDGWGVGLKLEIGGKVQMRALTCLRSSLPCGRSHGIVLCEGNGGVKRHLKCSVSCEISRVLFIIHRLNENPLPTGCQPYYYRRLT